MRVRSFLALTVGMCAAASVAWGQGVAPGAVERLLKSLDAPAAKEAPVVFQDDQGFVRALGAPVDGVFHASGTAKGLGPSGVALSFIEDHKDAFGISESSTVTTRNTLAHDNNSFVRLDQQVGGVPVYGADVVVQVNSAGNVLNVINDVARDLAAVDAGSVSLKPVIAASAAADAARHYVDGLYDKVSFAQLSAAGAPVLYVFQPSVLGTGGPVRLVWQVEVVATEPEPIRQEVLVDASSGESVFHYSLQEELRDRVIFDYNNSTIEPTVPVRSEGGGTYGQVDVDTAYSYLGDVYDFYFNHFGRDSFDDLGSTITGKVRYPIFNANWNGSFITIGTLVGADDVVAHEMTHAVTQYTSNLLYQGYSGAMNESMSDIFGEFVDLTNGKGDDQPAARWWIGEDVLDPAYLVEVGPADVGKNAFRSMKDPPLLDQPDRLGSSLLVSTSSFFDNGGVHTNSGIGNKLCYLLTDGDTFNNQTITGMGIDRTAALFYATQFLLPRGADYFDWRFALLAAAKDQKYSPEDTQNLKNACKAVEIDPTKTAAPRTVLNSFRAVPTRRTTGEPVISLTWSNPVIDQFSEIALVRNVAHFPANATDGVLLAGGKVEKFLDDVELQEGVTYYYGLFASVGADVGAQVAYARATAGGAVSPPAIEAFGSEAGPQGSASAIDLSFSQLTFAPAGPAVGTPGTSVNGISYEAYDTIFTPSVFGLPVQRDDVNGGAISLPLTDDELTTFSLGSNAIPFFGQWYSTIGIASNGYITFLRGDLEDVSTTPSLFDALSSPRINALFTDLNPAIGGQVWLKSLPDRLVVTYDSVPQFLAAGVPQTNTVQVEIYWSGTIRITYGSLANDPANPIGAVCGLSDGNGPGVDPADAFPDEHLQSVNFDVDLSQLPQSPSKLSIEPLGRFYDDAGARFTFTAHSVVPRGLLGTPILFAEWTGPGAVPFADNGDGTGTFDWQSHPADEGIYTVRIRTALNGQQAYVDVRLILLTAVLYPSATNLTLSTDTPFEDPTVSRFVGDDRPLIAGYTYVSPSPDDSTYDEGTSVIYWLRNGQTVPSLLNSHLVPASLTKPGDQWYFRVVPIAQNFVEGVPVASPVATIAGYPDIISITPNFGTIHGGDKVRITGSRMRGVLGVTFGGIDSAGIRAISDGEIEVTTPVHLPGTVPVAVRSSSGTGSLLNAFTFLGDGGDFPHADVNADGRVNATDIQLVINAVLQTKGVKGNFNGDVNRDGSVNSTDVQAVVNSALFRN